MKIKRDKLRAEYRTVSEEPIVELHNRGFHGTPIQVKWCEYCFPRKRKKKQ